MVYIKQSPITYLDRIFPQTHKLPYHTLEKVRAGSPWFPLRKTKYSTALSTTERETERVCVCVCERARESERVGEKERSSMCAYVQRERSHATAPPTRRLVASSSPPPRPGSLPALRPAAATLAVSSTIASWNQQHCIARCCQTIYYQTCGQGTIRQGQAISTSNEPTVCYRLRRQGAIRQGQAIPQATNRHPEPRCTCSQSPQELCCARPRRCFCQYRTLYNAASWQWLGFFLNTNR